ncbi:MAG: Phytochrome, two-component sensor histidine kinase [Thermoleophilia bacterium]|nr:Phytochrome, two-component sensor histidine kinase [Thermoleophilia bacterium]
MNSKFFALAHDMWCVASPEGRYRQVNPAWTRVLGWAVDEVTGESFERFIHPDDISGVVAILDELASGVAPPSRTYRMRAADGTYRSIDWRSSVDVETGEVFAAGRDVTDEERMRQRLVAREQALALLVAQQSNETEELLARLSGDLHDAAIQHLAAALMFLESGAELHPFAADAAIQVRLSLRALRRIMAGLDPLEDALDHPKTGFADLSEAIATQFGSTIECAVSGITPLPEGVGRTAFRVAREGLINACKYARSGPIRLEVGLATDSVRIAVHDPGCPGAAGRDEPLGAGRGLMLLDARVRAHGGDLTLVRSADGTTLSSRLPFHDPAFIAPVEHRHELSGSDMLSEAGR